jgi:NADH-quinone oxidoreductase subunit G
MTPDRQEVTLVVDGVEVKAPEGEMLVDAAKGGDVEIPVFCYEPKLGGPVGACRMCLVEIEGIPKLQTACSTPIRDGMVVYTRTDRVIEAQNAVVEFLLVNHPLDCPVCDKGGECPLQDIAMGWGPGKSRFTDPKRHFQKPVTLSPLVRIDRERCILCYRCVRFSQEVAEDEQLQLLDRGANSYVGTFDDRPYIAPFHGNIIELCPVGALTSEAYRFRARPWEIEDAGSICTLCPSQCNVKFTVRDERVQRVLARDNHEVDDGWLCDKGRFGFQMIASEERITEPRLGGNAAQWPAAVEAAATGLRAAGARTAAIVGGQASNEEGYLVQRILREALGSSNVTTTDELPADELRALSTARNGARVADLDTAASILVLGVDPLHAMPILDLRIRKAIRHGRARLVVASDRPTALDGGAEETARYAPGDQTGFLTALAEELGDGSAPEGPYRADAERIAGELRPGETVIVWGERIGRGPNGAAALSTLATCSALLKADEDGGGLIGVPDGANARGLREVGCLPDGGAGLDEIKAGLISGDLDALILVQADPIRDLPDGPGWAGALRQARTVISISSFDDASTKAANLVFPAETHAEKDGTVTHPDGRLQRLRPSVPHPDRVRPIWLVLAELAAALGHETGIDSAEEALEEIGQAVPFYGGITENEIGGKGVRWQDRESGMEWTAPVGRSGETVRPAQRPASPGPPAGGGLRLGTYRDLWADEVTERNAALRFLAPSQKVELAPSDAERLGVAQGDEADVRSNGTSVRARVAIRERMRPGAAFLIDGTAENNANVFDGAETVEIHPATSSASRPGVPGP